MEKHIWKMKDPRVYTIKSKNQTIGYKYQVNNIDKNLILCFKNVITARKVHYNLHPNPVLELDKVPADGSIVTVDCTLNIPKMEHTGGYLHAMNDGGFYLSESSSEEIHSLPYTANVGLILPYRLDDEDSQKFVFKSIIVSPSQHTALFCENLLNNL
jgi:hypothetical protein